MKKITIFVAVIFLFYGFLFAQDVPTDGLVAYYSFDNDVDTTIVDDSGNNANGAAMFDVGHGPGYMGQAIELDGYEQYVDCGTQDGLFDFTEQITLAAWVMQYDAGNGEHNPWIAKGDHAWALKHRLDPFYEFFIYNGTWVTVRVEDADEIISHNGEWHHFAGTYDGFALNLYVDGEWRATTEWEGSIDLSEHPVNIGRNAEASDRLFNGMIDEVRIYEVALNEDEVATLYNYTSGVFDRKNMEKNFYLHQNYPNPFNPSTSISYSLPASAFVTMKVYDMLGREIQTLVNTMQPHGVYAVIFDASTLASGVYFYSLQAGDQFFEMKKMVLMR